jgi:adenylate cyclase
LVRLTSLRQRLYLWLLLPVAVLLTGLSVAGFYFARNEMARQWRGTALFSLERVAHEIDMRLEQPAAAVETVNQVALESPLEAAEWKALLSKVPGVEKVDISLDPGYSPVAMQPGSGPGAMRRSRDMSRGHGMRFHRARIAEVTNPRIDASTGQSTVLMIFELKDQAGQVQGRLELSVLFSYLLKDLLSISRWQGEGGYLVDDTGLILTRTKGSPNIGERLGESGNELELRILQEMIGKSSGTDLGRGSPPEQVAGFYRLKQAPWTLVLIADGEKVLWPIIRFLRIYVASASACVVLVLLLIHLVTGRVASSVRTVCQAARRVAQGDYEVKVPEPNTNDEFHRLAESFNTMVDGLKEKDFIRDTFGRYIDEEVARQLMSKPEATRLGGQKRWVAVMMSDVRGFTALCDGLSPEQTISIINRYLSGLIEVIRKHHGIIVDFLGDAVLVFFDSSELPIAEAARKAVCCALDLRQATDDFNQTMREEGLPALETAFGLNAGEVVVGNIGSQTRTKYGIVGGPVNLTSRIQAQAEGGEILVSQSIQDLLSDDLNISRSFSTNLKGVEHDVTLHHVEGLHSCTGQNLKTDQANSLSTKPDSQGGQAS